METFKPDTLVEFLQQIPVAAERGSIPRLVIAYSGGMDSHVLLHALHSVRNQLVPCELHAVHVNHGLQDKAAQWSAHCESVCRALDIPVRIFDVNAHAEKGESPEAAARHARYTALHSFIQAGDVLLTAHHQNDQAETLMLQLLRGGGPHGLASMPKLSVFGPGWHARPLLGVSREALTAYAHSMGLRWIEDSSNTDTGYDRNYIRHEVMPVLQRRWPSAARTMSRVAAHSAEATRLMDILAADDLARVKAEADTILSLPHLLALEPARIRNTLRMWIQLNGFALPATRHMDRIMQDILQADEGSSPCVNWEGTEVHRYRDRIHVMPPLPDVSAEIREWDARQPLELPASLGTLVPQPVVGQGIRQALVSESRLSIRFRQGGEQCCPAGRGHTHSLKKMFQEQGIPPWERDRIPLIYIGEDIAMVAGLWLCEPFQARTGEAGIRIAWQTV